MDTDNKHHEIDDRLTLSARSSGNRSTKSPTTSEWQCAMSA